MSGLSWSIVVKTAVRYLARRYLVTKVYGLQVSHTRETSQNMQSSRCALLELLKPCHQRSKPHMHQGTKSSLHSMIMQDNFRPWKRMCPCMWGDALCRRAWLLSGHRSDRTVLIIV